MGILDEKGLAPEIRGNSLFAARHQKGLAPEQFVGNSLLSRIGGTEQFVESGFGDRNSLWKRKFLMRGIVTVLQQ